ncbi:enoyl-CoA hydratase/isomerase [Rhizoctonia solani AG-3 Rhs1AP]|uniref:Probable enoyl-CoA hydratase, mitochondrial n=1 Tax=Rhizoctonia solani AG-3 Rhs1AP TaxID=1086054 RepID=X8JKT5_9AGAM|nr:enoyl-CoA hydratase/isomerase [Rhizoctonia solani AG-3 Rhs1AP]
MKHGTYPKALSHASTVSRRALGSSAARIIQVPCMPYSVRIAHSGRLIARETNSSETMLSSRAALLSSHAVGISRRGFTSARPLSKEYQNLLVSRPKPNVTLLTLNRPKALNALSTPLFEEINEVLDQVEKDEEIGALVVTGSEKAFAAGADIKEMKDKEFTDVYKNNFLGDWTRITSFRKPVIAAVSGFALGGGCELAMMCDIILASPTARFGQPEIKLGVIPGAGGTQRLTHAIGKSRAMELVLTGRMITAQEAEKWGLVSRIVEGDLVEEAVSMASTIAGFGRVAVQAGKESVNAAYELSLKDGLHFERRIFQSLFATQDQKEGMSAFADKREPKWSHS